MEDRTYKVRFLELGIFHSRQKYQGGMQPYTDIFDGVCLGFGVLGKETLAL